MADTTGYTTKLTKGHRKPTKASVAPPEVPVAPPEVPPAPPEVPPAPPEVPVEASIESDDDTIVRVKAKKKQKKRKCEHGRDAYKCHDCNGSAFCKHRKRKELCPDPACGGGTSLCKLHGNGKTRKSRCRECNGSELCEHGRLKNTCKECDGASICREHGKPTYKPNCLGCNGSARCIHNKLKYYCKACDGRFLCKSSWCETTANKKYDGYCFTCFVHTCSDREIARYFRSKEDAVGKFLQATFTKYQWIFNRKVADGCSTRRPDALLDLGYVVIVVEVDENQHRAYDCSCENKRLMEISQDIGHRPLVMIRFNPDAYEDSNGKKQRSPWTYDHGVANVNIEFRHLWEARLDVLKKAIMYWADETNKTDKTVEVIPLFFHGFSPLARGTRSKRKN